MGPDEREWIARKLAEDPELAAPWDGVGPSCAPDDVFPWLQRAHVGSVLQPGHRGYLTQEWRSASNRVDPNSCRHEIGRGKHWLAKRKDSMSREAIRPGKGLTIVKDVTCRICGKVLSGAD